MQLTQIIDKTGKDLMKPMERYCPLTEREIIFLTKNIIESFTEAKGLKSYKCSCLMQDSECRDKNCAHFRIGRKEEKEMNKIIDPFGGR